MADQLRLKVPKLSALMDEAETDVLAYMYRWHRRRRRKQADFPLPPMRTFDRGLLVAILRLRYRKSRGFMSTSAATIPGAGSARRRLRKSPFFTLLGLLLLTLAIAGFWPQYFSAVTGRSPTPATRFWLIHVHSTLFTLWLLLYVFQAALVMLGRPRLHLKIGPWLAWFGFTAAAIGLYSAALLAHRLGARENDYEAAAAFVFFPLIDMVFFAAFLAAALAYRKLPQVHKRAMFLATFSIAVVGLGRLVGRAGLENALIWQTLNLAPLLIAICHDIIVSRRVYFIMAVGLLVHLLRLNAEGFAATEAWLPVGRALIAPFR